MKHHTFSDWLKDHEGQALFGLYTQSFRADTIRDKVLLRHVRFYGKIPELWYYLKCKLFKKYNHVHAKTLPPTYCDPRSLLLHSSFEVLRLLVEEEKIFEWVRPEGDPDDGESWAWALNEISELYNWWTRERPKDQQREEHLLMKWYDYRNTGYEEEFHQQLRRMEEYNNDKDTEMLKRLAEVRPYMWT